MYPDEERSMVNFQEADPTGDIEPLIYSRNWVDSSATILTIRRSHAMSLFI